MPRYKLLMEYDGTAFHGWQAQKGVPSVQGSLSEALRAYCGVEAIFHGAGRTDVGVHALGQVAHLDLPEPRPLLEIQAALNFYLKGICILNVEQVADSFDARHSARKRVYLYKIIIRTAPLVLMHRRAWHFMSPLDLEAMRLAAQTLLGTHDFTTFRSAHCQAASAVKTLETIDIHHTQETSQVCLSIVYAARSFLHTQVRSLTAALCQVGKGQWQPRDLQEALGARDRHVCPPLAPPWGLYLQEVLYEEK